MLARSMAELGRSVVLVDMTVSGCPTRLMAAEPDLPGMADLLFGETAFGETIHHDRLSNAHVVPQGLSTVLPSGKITERLMMIVGALSDTYDTVLLEFGSADISGVLRLMKYVDAEIVLSLPVADDERADEALLELASFGYNDIMTMSEQSSRERSAA
jgi:Mrp family chromosome partitioning ATPase